MSGMTASSPRPRRIATPSWLDLRLVIGVVLVLASVAVGAAVVSRAGDKTAVVAITRDLAAGTVLRGEDLTTTKVQLSGGGHGVYLTSVADAVGHQLAHAVARGELLPAAAISDVPAQTALTLQLPAGAAPDLHAGQRIEVWVSTGNCSSVVLLPDVTVQSVRTDGDDSFGTASGAQVAVVSVSSAVASRVVSAQSIDGVQIRAGVLVGGDVQPSAARSLPDLAPCLAASGHK